MKTFGKKGKKGGVCEKKWLKKGCLGSGFTDFLDVFILKIGGDDADLTNLLFEKIVVDSRVSLQTLGCPVPLDLTRQMPNLQQMQQMMS